MRTGFMIFKLVLGAIILVIINPTTYANTYNSGFNTNKLDIDEWYPYATDVAFYIDSSKWVFVRNQRLELITCFCGSSGIRSQWRLVGDFDIQVDYKMLNIGSVDWNIGLMSGDCHIERESSGGNRYTMDYPLWYGPDPWDRWVSNTVSTNDLSGALRLVRTGTTTTGYYWDTAQWISLDSVETGDEPEYVRIYAETSIWNIGAAFDNFTVNSGTLGYPIPEPSSILALSGFCGLGILNLHKKK